jgi:hypothetical protein
MQSWGHYICYKNDTRLSVWAQVILIETLRNTNKKEPDRRRRSSGAIRRGDPCDRPTPQIEEMGEYKIRPYEGHFVSILRTARSMRDSGMTRPSANFIALSPWAKTCPERFHFWTSFVLERSGHFCLREARELSSAVDPN